MSTAIERDITLSLYSFINKIINQYNFTPEMVNCGKLKLPVVLNLLGSEFFNRTSLGMNVQYTQTVYYYH